MTDQTITYGGFWRRLAAHFIDMFLITAAMGIIVAICFAFSRFGLDLRSNVIVYNVLGTALGIVYEIYFVVRFGGSPGKRAMRLRIQKLDGAPVDVRAAWLRYSVGFVLSLILGLGFIIAIPPDLSIEDLLRRMMQPTPGGDFVPFPNWYHWTSWVVNAWTWSEFVVMLANKKRRAIHDFIAGTVVIYEAPAPVMPKASEVTPLPTHE